MKLLNSSIYESMIILTGLDSFSRKSLVIVKFSSNQFEKRNKKKKQLTVPGYFFFKLGLNNNNDLIP